MFRTLFVALTFLKYMITRRVRYFYMVSVKKVRPEAFMDEWVRTFADRILKRTLTDLRITGQEHLSALPTGRPVMAVSNHESYLDIPSLMVALRGSVCFIAKKELARIPLLGFWIRALGGQLIDRGNLRRSHETFTRGVKMSPGKALLVFPEGTRNKSSTVATFKPGSLRPAFENRAVILPVCIRGGRRKFEGNGYRIRPGGIHVVILPPVDTGGVPVQEKRRLAGELHAGILRVYERIAPLSA